jgi:uncharacterized membrane protein YhaH (DUF805 family)
LSKAPTSSAAGRTPAAAPQGRGFLATLFTIDGRMSRKPYWLIGVALLLFVIVVTAALTAIGVATFDVALVEGLAAAFELIILVPTSAIMVKRFHDRDKSGWLVLLLIVPTLVSIFGDMLGVTGRPEPLPDIPATATLFEAWLQVMQARAVNRTFEFALGLWMLAVMLWFFVELGFFRGTRGPNRFGPDPVAGRA